MKYLNIQIIIMDSYVETGTYPDGTTFEKHFIGCRITHRDNDEPAYIEYNKDNCELIEYEEYHYHNEWHRDNDKPAVVKYYPNGDVMYEVYYKNNRYYRPNNKPHKVEYSEDGNIITEYWYNDQDNLVNKIVTNIVEDLTKPCRD